MPEPASSTLLPDTITQHSAAQIAQCQQAELGLQILGSGGPIADDERASSSYLVWHRGRAVALVDVGGGSFQRFGAAGAQLDTLAFIALSHLHTDHSADLAALMKGAYFSDRDTPLPLFGPAATEPGAKGDPFPSTSEYTQALFSHDHGAYRYLSGLLDGSDGLFQLKPEDLNHTVGQQTQQQLQFTLPEQAVEAIELRSLGVHHGSVPALAYRLVIAGRELVFSGDQSEHNPAMIEFARGADVLVAHIAIPPQAGRGARSLHRLPESWAHLAAQAEVKQLVLSHWMRRSLRQRDEVLAAIRENYRGPLVNATDLACVVL